MAAEEVNKPKSLPPYPEIILKAIEELNEKNGSNKSSISKHIESTYGDLPAGHSTLLTHHLNKLKDSGDLVFLKNNASGAQMVGCKEQSLEVKGSSSPKIPKRTILMRMCLYV
jgi:hypothetical protein